LLVNLYSHTQSLTYSLKTFVQVQTLLSRMEQLRGTAADSANGNLPTPIHGSVAQLKDVIVKVQMCRRDEIVNAINRHQHRDIGSPMQKEKGCIKFLILQPRLVTPLVFKLDLKNAN